MCGIAGFVGGFVTGLVKRMNQVQPHQRPDGQGTFEDPGAGVALGHVRLAILDVTEAAAQPLRSLDGRYVLVFKGGDIQLQGASQGTTQFCSKHFWVSSPFGRDTDRTDRPVGWQGRAAHCGHAGPPPLWGSRFGSVT